MEKDTFVCTYIQFMNRKNIVLNTMKIKYGIHLCWNIGNYLRSIYCVLCNGKKLFRDLSVHSQSHKVAIKGQYYFPPKIQLVRDRVQGTSLAAHGDLLELSQEVPSRVCLSPYITLLYLHYFSLKKFLVSGLGITGPRHQWCAPGGGTPPILYYQWHAHGCTHSWYFFTYSQRRVSLQAHH